MWKSIIYKEWLKIRWFVIGFTALGMLAVGYIFLKVQHDIAFMQAKNYWYAMLFQGMQYFSYLHLMPLLGGLAIGIAQYFPETVNKRIKLTFHLPVNENKVLLMMLAFGAACIVASFGILFLLFFIFSKMFFAGQIVTGAFITIFPWIWSGVAAYFLVGLIVMEPIWKYRIMYAIVSVFFLGLYLKSVLTASYVPVNPVLFVLSILLSISMLFSAYRFRKGEM